MKKVSLLLMLAVFALVSCSSDDNKGSVTNTEIGVDKEKSLVLQASSTNILTGEEVTFKLVDDKGVEVDGDIMLNGSKITKSFVFTEIGTFNVTGVKEGYKTSNVVTVIVSEDVNDVENTTKLVVNDKELDLAFCTLEYRLLDRGVNVSTDEVVGAVFDLGDGVYGNQYSLILETRANDSANKGYMFIELLVPNPTIVMGKNGEVIDYGKRVLPTKDTKVKLRAIFSGIEGFSVNDTPKKVHEYSVVINKFDFAEEADDFGEYEGHLDLKFTYQSESDFKMDFQFNDVTYMVAFE